MARLVERARWEEWGRGEESVEENKRAGQNLEWLINKLRLLSSFIFKIFYHFIWQGEMRNREKEHDAEAGAMSAPLDTLTLHLNTLLHNIRSVEWSDYNIGWLPGNVNVEQN